MTTVDEKIRREFESDWLQGSRGNLADYLPKQDSPDYLATLEELICIDLEFRWTTSSSNEAEPPLLEEYLDRFPPLREAVVLQRLVDQEIWVRNRSTHPPSPMEYQQRFPELRLPSRFRQAVGDASTQGYQSTIGVTTAGDERCPRPFGKYELVSILGRGGMGKVFRARQEQTDRMLAIKVTNVGDLEADTRKEIQTRFEAEIRAAAKVSHDNLMPIHDVGEADGCLYYTMPILGGDLAAEVRRKPMPNKPAAEYLAQAARGLAAAHKHGLLHRDLKPHNLMLDRDKNRVMIADFGLARLASAQQHLTRAGEVIGSPPYMSPEQIQDARTVDARADIYALGATLYHLLTGRPPFHAATAAETLRQVMDDDPVSPRLLNPQVDRDLETICLRCLQKDPQWRFQSASELAEDLERYGRDEPIRSRPLGTFGRLARWRRRNPVVASLAGALFSSLILLVVVAIIGWYSTRKQLGRVVATSRQGQSALNDLFTFVRTEPLLNQPGQELVRKQLLERGMQHYQSLIDLAEENETLPTDLVAARTAMGLLFLELHGPELAADQFREAIETAGTLPESQQQSRQVQQALGDSWNGLGQALHQAGDDKQSVDAFTKAIEIRKGIPKESAADIDPPRKLANAMMNRGLVQAAVGSRDEARREYAAAQDQRRELLVTAKDDPKLLRDFAQGQFNLARLDLSGADADRGKELLDDATERFEKLTRQYPADVLVWQRYIECLLTQGLVYDAPPSATDGQPAGPVMKALELLRPLVMLAPENRTYRLRLIELYQLGIEQMLPSGNAADAQQAWLVVQEQLMAPLAADTQTDVVRLRLIHLRQGGLIALGQGRVGESKRQLQIAIDAWQAARTQPQFASLNTPEQQREWEDLQSLADSLQP